MQVLRSTLFNLGLYLVTVIHVGFIPLLFFVPKRWRTRYLTKWGDFALWWLKLTCDLDYEVIGSGNIPAGPAIVLSKHQSAFETIALQQVFPTQTWVLKRELLRVPFFGWGLAMMEPIAIDRKAGKKALRQVIEQGIDRLKRGIWVVVFPEGTRVSPGETGHYGIGGAMLAEKSGYTVVPVAHNAGEFWPRHGFVKKAGTITISVGKPIDPGGMKASEINQVAKEWIETECRQITTLPQKALT